MCTAITFKTGAAYFGRTLDIEYHYKESVTVTPQNFPFHFREEKEKTTHYAIIGMAYIENGYPLYYDAANEHGLSAAGLNFPGNAAYMPPLRGKTNIAPFEFIPWLLGSCKDLLQAKELLKNINFLDANFSESLPAAPLHWLLADKTGASLTVEPTKKGVLIYENPLGVLTNNPPFEFQMQNLENYMALSPEEPRCAFAPGLDIKPSSKGMGAFGLPGDLSSKSRFIKAAFTKLNSVCGASEEESVTQFFHILGAVEQQKGCVRLPGGALEKTVYTSCVNTEKGIYYYKTYENSRIRAVEMEKENLGGKELAFYPIEAKQDIFWQNRTLPK